jgi:hypothetical protein
MRHALLERIPALRTEEMAIMPMLAQRHGMFANDRRLAVLTARRVEFVPVEMAIEAQPLIAVVGYGLAFDVFELLARSATLDAGEARGAHWGGLGADFEGFERGAAGVADEAVGVEALGEAAEGYDAAFDGELALVAGCCCSVACCW